MLVVTTDRVSGHDVAKVVGHCFGVVVRSRGIGGNLVAAFRTFLGGEVPEYTELLEDARRSAMRRMAASAAGMGANAVLAFRFDTAELAQTMTEVVAYGTAVVLVPSAPGRPSSPDGH